LTHRLTELPAAGRVLSGLLAGLLLLGGTSALAAQPRELLQLFVTEPYLELHTAPGSDYPVTQVVTRGESVDVLKRQTEWFKVRTERGIEGWAYERDLMKTRLADGAPFVFRIGDLAGFTDHRWEDGVMAGSYGGATLISAYGAFSLTNETKIELTEGQFLGNLSNGYLLELGLNHVFLPGKRCSPFVTLGTGYERLNPKGTLAAPLDQDSQTAYAGIGVRFYVGRRFFLRGEYRHHTVFTSRDSNEVKQEWKAGIAFFY
jgi:hypothetical protein